MDGTRHNPILNYLHRVLGTPPEGGVSDADLLRRFVRERDEAAFELLLWRHAAMVLRVCRQVLHDEPTAEDAFQATFLVFVRKAGSISRGESLGGWLYRVAYHIALKARQQITKQGTIDPELDHMASRLETDDADQRELREMICEEVNRLPAKYRAPIVACYFEAKTHEEAASQLGWPRGTVAGRLNRARELLRRRLVRRGLTFTMGAFAAALAVPATQAARAGLIDSTIQTAKRFAAGSAEAVVSPRIAALAEGVLQTMYGTRIKIVAAVLLLAGLGGVGTAFWGTQKREAEPPSDSALRGGARAPEEGAAEPTDAAKLARHKALSRLNLRKLAAAMHSYADALKNQNCLPAPAIYSKDGKALLSWRVELLPYLGEMELYKQFKRDEPWDSRNNKKLLPKMPAVYAPPGVKTRQPFLTFYQVFVSDAIAGQGMFGGAAAGAGGSAGAPGAGGGAGGAGPGGGAVVPFGATPFLKGVPQRFPASITDGTSNTILIIEAGNPVPWTKPEDLTYAADQPLPKLGGLFPDVFHAAFADGQVRTLTKKYDEKHLRFAITSNGGEIMELEKIEAPPRRGASAPADAGDRDLAKLRRTNEALRQELERAREQIRQLKEERDLQREQSGPEKRPSPRDPQSQKLLLEQAQLREELQKARIEMEALNAEIQRLQRPTKKAVERKGP